MGLTPKPNPAWLLDPLHLQQENYLYPYCPGWQTHTHTFVSHTLALGSSSHICLWVLIMHVYRDMTPWVWQCITVSRTVAPDSSALHLSLTPDSGTGTGGKKQPVNRTFEHLPTNMIWIKCLWIVTVEFILVSYQNEMPHYKFHHSAKWHWFYLTI